MLRFLKHIASISIVVDPECGALTEKVSYHGHDVTVAEALEKVLDQRKLKYRLQEGVVYVYRDAQVFDAMPIPEFAVLGLGKLRQTVPKIDFNDTELPGVLTFLGECFNVSIRMDDSMAEADVKVTLHATNIEFVQIMRLLAQMHHLRYRMASGRIVVSRTSATSAPAGERSQAAGTGVFETAMHGEAISGGAVMPPPFGQQVCDPPPRPTEPTTPTQPASQPTQPATEPAEHGHYEEELAPIPTQPAKTQPSSQTQPAQSEPPAREHYEKEMAPRPTEPAPQTPPTPHATEMAARPMPTSQGDTQPSTTQSTTTQASQPPDLLPHPTEMAPRPTKPDSPQSTKPSQGE